MPILSHLRNYDHVIWDWNGTLLDDVDHALAAIAPILDQHGLRRPSRDEYRDVFGFPVRDYYEKLGFNLNQQSFEALSDQFVREFGARMAEAKLFDGAREMLAEIAATKCQSILSAAHESYLHKMMRHFAIEEYFDFVCGIDNHYADGKLERGRQLMAAAKIAPAATILVGDTDHDLEVGEALGIDVLLVADGHQSYHRLKARHHRVIESRLGR